MKKFDYQECMEKHGGYAVTRDGDKMRLLCDDRPDDDCPIVTMNSDGHVRTYTIEGHYSSAGASAFTLFTPTTKFNHERWVNVYPDNILTFHISEEEAHKVRVARDCIATIKITIEGEEGEGL